MTEEEARAIFARVLASFEEAAGEHVTERERDVLYHRVVVGLNNRDIATVLVISIKTVQSHIVSAGIRLRYVGRHQDLERALTREWLRAEQVSSTSA